MDLSGVKGAVDKLNTETVPQVLTGANALVDRLEALLDRLDGAELTATVTLRLKPAGLKETP